MMSIGERVRLARKAKHISQLKLRELTGIGQSTLSELETGKNEQTIYVASLATALGVSAIWLAEGKGPMIARPPTVVAELDNAILLLTLYRQSSESGRSLILDAARLADKAGE